MRLVLFFLKTLMTQQQTDVLELLSKRLDRQLHRFLESMKRYNKLRLAEKQRASRDYDYLEDFYHRFLAGQNQRALEIVSPEYLEIVELADRQFPYPTSWVLCMDGRVLPVLISGASADIGDNMRVPGGNIREFVRGINGKFTLLEHSNFAKLLASAFERVESDTIVEVFDSHVACAAVKAEETARGREPADGGLLRDVLHKREMAEATKEFARHKLADKKKVIVIQTSFDPHNGFMFMGLETEYALAFAKEKDPGVPSFTGEVLHALAAEGKIISSEHIAHELAIRKLFEKYAFSPDWRTKYIQTSGQFWHAIDAMKHDAYASIEGEVLKVYPQISKKR